MGCRPAAEPTWGGPRPRPLQLALTFCLLPVGGGVQVHLRRHGQGRPSAHPSSPPHRRRPPSPNSRWGPRGPRQGARPGARGAEELPRGAQLSQAAGHAAPQRHERAARGSPPPGTPMTALWGDTPCLLRNRWRCQPRRPAPSPRAVRPGPAAVPRSTLGLVVPPPARAPPSSAHVRARQAPPTPGASSARLRPPPHPPSRTQSPGGRVGLSLGR